MQTTSNFLERSTCNNGNDKKKAHGEFCFENHHHPLLPSLYWIPPTSPHLRSLCLIVYCCPTFSFTPSSFHHYDPFVFLLSSTNPIFSSLPASLSPTIHSILNVSSSSSLKSVPSSVCQATFLLLLTSGTNQS